MRRLVDTARRNATFLKIIYVQHREILSSYEGFSKWCVSTVGNCQTYVSWKRSSIAWSKWSVVGQNLIYAFDPHTTRTYLLQNALAILQKFNWKWWTVTKCACRNFMSLKIVIFWSIAHTDACNVTLTAQKIPRAGQEKPFTRQLI